jgi:glycosyltransferase involved in cell wall biosynthesis
MKIAHIILTSQNGGAERVFIDYLKILKKIGHQNYFIVKNDAPYFDIIKDIAVDHLKISNHFGYHDFIAIKKIKNFVEKNNIEVVVAHAGRSIALVHKALKSIKSRKVILVAVNHSNNIKRSLLADIIISVNREIFYKTIDAKRTIEDSFILSNAIDISDINPPVKNKNLADQKIITIGIIGRLVKAKGFDIVIKSLSKINSSSNIKFILKIAGDGEEKNNLKNLVKSLNLAESVEFLGWVENQQDFFSNIDIFILPSLAETFGLVLLEAMKYGVPIITTNCDGPKEILKPDIDCLMLDLNDKNHDLPSQITTAIIKLINDKDLANNLIENAFIRLQKRYSFDILEKNLADLFKIEKL